MSLIVPENYDPKLSIRETETGWKPRCPLP